jgi:hypothetical protein
MPDEAMSEYCISTITADSEGNVYYKNDSGNIFAVGKKTEKLSLFQWLIQFIKKFFSNITGR